MKKAKILVSLVLALAMVFAMAIPAFAAETTETKGKITITNATVDQTYTIYQILDLKSFDSAKGLYSYKATAKWDGFINSAAIKDVYVTVDEDGYVKPKTDAKFEEFAKLAKEYAANPDNHIDNQGSQTPTSTDPTATTTTVEFTGLELGYYLVDSSIGTICSLDTTDTDVEIKEKNAEPTVDKNIVISDTETKKSNTVNLGDTVNYKTTIQVKAGAENYVLHDTMENGLTLDPATIKVSVGGTDVPPSVTNADGTKTNYTKASDDHSFTITFDNAYINELATGLVKEPTETSKEIVVTYSAKLNKDAEIAGNGNDNKTWLTYGDEPNSTAEIKTTTYTWDFNVFKYTGTEDNKTALEGATFTLSRNDDDSNPIELVKVTDGSATNPQTADVYRLAIDGDAADKRVTEITTNKSGRFTIQGLDAGKYYLKETKAPDGYNLPSKHTVVQIEEDGRVNVSEALPNGVLNKTIEILNQSGPELPSTGGIGTTIFYIVGGILLVGAGVVLVVRRRMRTEAKSK